MTPEQIEQLRRSLASCLMLGSTDAALAHLEESLVTVLEPLLENLFGLLALARGADQGVEPDPGYPGYVRLPGKISISVPVHLVLDFPPEAVRVELAELLEQIRRCPGSAICLSGSALFLGALADSADIDCCEYVDIADRHFAEGIVNAVAMGTPPIASLRVKVGLGETTDGFARPWPPSAEEVVLKIRRLAAVAESSKVDFVCMTTFGGVLDASNLVLRVDTDRCDTGEALRSFAAQEAVMGAWIPRRLTNPRELGRYLNWLRRQVESHRAVKPIKAMKRALSLSRLLMLEPTANRIIDALNTSCAGAAARRDAKEKLHQRLVISPELAPFTDALTTELQQPGPIFGEEAFFDRVGEVCDELLQQLHRLEDSRALG